MVANPEGNECLPERPIASGGLLSIDASATLSAPHPLSIAVRMCPCSCPCPFASLMAVDPACPFPASVCNLKLSST